MNNDKYLSMMLGHELSEIGSQSYYFEGNLEIQFQKIFFRLDQWYSITLESHGYWIHKHGFELPPSFQEGTKFEYVISKEFINKRDDLRTFFGLKIAQVEVVASKADTSFLHGLNFLFDDGSNLFIHKNLDDEIILSVGPSRLLKFSVVHTLANSD